MKTNTFLIPRVVQVPTGVWQVALPNWKALHKTLDLSFLAARFLFPLFWGSFDKSLSRRLVSGCQEPRTAQYSAPRDSRSLQHLLRPRVKAGLGTVRRWTCSGKLSSGSQHFLGVAGSDVATRAGAASTSSARLWRARGACDLAVLKREQFACDAVLAGFAGRHGEEQRVPGGRRATRSPAGGA